MNLLILSFPLAIMALALASSCPYEAETVCRKVIATNLVLPPFGFYSRGIQANNVLYLSGSSGTTLESRLLDGISNQTRQSLINMGHVLNAAGASFENVVKTTISLINIEDYATMNEVYGEVFAINPPARSVFIVSMLPNNALIEIEGVAVLGNVI